MVMQDVLRRVITKWGGANFLFHSKDGFKATAVIEYEEDEGESDRRCSAGKIVPDTQDTD